MNALKIEKKLLAIYDRLFQRYGDLNWWPGDTPFEVAIGAVLTQNTAWTQVEKSIHNLKEAKCLDTHALDMIPDVDLEDLIRPSGFAKNKTQTVRRLNAWWQSRLVELEGRMVLKKETPLNDLRADLLSLKGIGPETADSILLYALNLPTFVIDAYTRRMLVRHFDSEITMDYETLRSLFMDHLPEDVQLFNRYHALIVENAKCGCLKKECRTTCALHSLIL